MPNPTPQESDSVEAARRRLIMRSHGGPLTLDTTTDKMLWEQFETAVVERERTLLRSERQPNGPLYVEVSPDNKDYWNLWHHFNAATKSNNVRIEATEAALEAAQERHRIETNTLVDEMDAALGVKRAELEASKERTKALVEALNECHDAAHDVSSDYETLVKRVHAVSHPLVDSRAAAALAQTTDGTP